MLSTFSSDTACGAAVHQHESPSDMLIRRLHYHVLPSAASRDRQRCWEHRIGLSV